MKLARVSIDGREVIARLEGSALAPVRMTAAETESRAWLRWGSDEAAARPAAGPTIPVDLATYLPVVEARNIIAVGLNYVDHATESEFEPPSQPLLFAKTGNTLAAHGDVIRCPADLTGQADYEAELAVVIGRRTSGVSQAAALAHVAGYTVANDVSARDAQFRDGQWMRGKSFDTFCPLGPFLTLADAVPDVMDLRITTRLNGQVMQDDRTSSMIFSVPYLISYVSRFLTLVPGDVILTGTPAGVGFARRPAVYLQDADVVEVEVEGLGCLRNIVSTAASATGAAPVADLGESRA
ncbi:MAG: 5-carboxymethyl-2-hydroxymuconate delta-isomerase [Frankiales bacterium]|nr:5-carboxymethyl-2-hydroxymuconate delta-isomerase [Frankiales bacterium]